MNGKMEKDSSRTTGKHIIARNFVDLILKIRRIHIHLFEKYLIVYSFKGYRILDQIEFCDFDQPLSCESKTASNSTSGKLIFDVDVKERYFKNYADVNYDASDIPVKLQREDCLCDWRLCNGCDLVVFKWYIISISVLCKFLF